MQYDQQQYTQPIARIRREKQNLNPTRNPFDSPNVSTTSLHDTDGGSTSEQDEFHLQRYSSNAKYRYLREVSRSASGEDRDKKPDLNIITNFSGPNMPMKSQDVTVSKVHAKRIPLGQRSKTISVISHKAIQATASPPGQEMQSPRIYTTSPKNRRPFRSSKQGRIMQSVQQPPTQKQISPLTQRIPIGIIIPREDAQQVDQTVIDSALPIVTPMTPAIVVTPAGQQKPWLLQRRRSDGNRRIVSSMYSSMPFDHLRSHNSKTPTLPSTTYADIDEKMRYQGPRASQESSEMILPASADTARPDSQGWWNLMLSPLLRAGSLASRKARQATDTPPIPPVPLPSEKYDSPALSARSDPSFMISSSGTSPETPRRQGLASARASTWSKWTEWEREREANFQEDTKNEENLPDQADTDMGTGEGLVPTSIPRTGLAVEYFHACAVEELTGRPYFECINHSCAAQLPKLQAIFDAPESRSAMLASPFESPLVQNLGMEVRAAKDVKSPSVLEKAECLSPNDLSPNVRQASVAPVVKAKALDSSSDKGSITMSSDNLNSETTADKGASFQPLETMDATRPAASCTPTRSNDALLNVAVNAPPPQVVEIKVIHEGLSASTAFEPLSEKVPVTRSTAISSPTAMSPEGQSSLAPTNALPLSDMKYRQTLHSEPMMFTEFSNHDELPSKPAFITAETEFPPLPTRAPTATVTAADLQKSSRRLDIEKRRRRDEKEDGTARNIGRLWRGRGCFPKKGCMGRGGPEKRTKRRWILGISLVLLAIVITCIILAVTLTRKGDGTPVDSQWLNLTGYPPMPTGVLTIAAPNLASQQNQCAAPTTMWSCSLPKENQDEIGSNDPDQPNFRFEIKFRNGTVPANMTLPVSGSQNTNSKSSSDPFTNDLFVPNPQPPNDADQLFLGQTTDNITAPFDGEKTPFFITFLSSFPVDPSNLTTADTTTKRLMSRQSNSSLLNDLPAPALADDGSAAPASLLPTTPYPISQPVRLYNRGQQDEHYGFYMYYDKSIFLSGVSINDSSTSSETDNAVEADQNGGTLKAQASARCTFAQTRFVVKFFTNQAFGVSLLPSTVNSNLSDSANTKKSTTNSTSSATDFNRPGSFPYPATIILDRHGGDINTKAVYCYGMTNGQINKDQKLIVGETRGFGGQLVNGVPDLLSGDNGFNSTAGGIDGGTGGCRCSWQNWQ